MATGKVTLSIHVEGASEAAAQIEGVRRKVCEMDGLCQVDGYTEDQNGNEHYWSCGESATQTVGGLKVCGEHADQLREEDD